MNQYPIFLLGAHKSGTSLLRSLIDGYSQLFTVPIESHYFQNMHHWVDYDYRSQLPERLSRKDIIENFSAWIHKCNISSDKYGDSIVSGKLDEKKFREYFSQIRSDNNDKEIIERYFEAIYFSLYNKKLSDSVRVVEKSVENAEFAIELFHLFPHAKFINIIRNPYANTVSFRKYKSIHVGYPLMPRIIRSLYNSYYFLYKNIRIIPNYLIIRYEDLVLNPEKTIQKICNFLNISFEKILLIPTSEGKFWAGNSMTGKRFDGIDSSLLNIWRSEIHPMEVKYINSLFPFILKDFGYDYFEKNGSFWKIAKGENMKRYFYNRLYYYYKK